MFFTVLIVPKRKSSLGRETPAAKRRRLLLQVESQDGRANRLRQNRKNTKWSHKDSSAFHYNPSIDYESDKSLSVDTMSTVCNYCLAKKWKNERNGLCCAAGKVHLEPFQAPSEFLRVLLLSDHPESSHFLKFIRCYNPVFQMTSFGG